MTKSCVLRVGALLATLALMSAPVLGAQARPLEAKAASHSCGTTRIWGGRIARVVVRTRRPTCPAALSLTKNYYRKLARALARGDYPDPYLYVGSYRCISYSGYRGMDCTGPGGRSVFADRL